MNAGATTLIYRFPGTGIAPEIGRPRWFVESPANLDATTAAYNFTELAGKFAPHFAKLKRVEADRTLWAEGAEPPSMTAVTWARAVLQQLQEDALEPTRVVASAEGGVAICFVSGNKYCDIECLNTGAVLGVTSNRRDRPTAWEIRQDARGLALATARIRRFIYTPSSSKDASER